MTTTNPTPQETPTMTSTPAPTELIPDPGRRRLRLACPDGDLTSIMPRANADRLAARTGADLDDLNDVEVAECVALAIEVAAAQAAGAPADVELVTVRPVVLPPIEDGADPEVVVAGVIALGIYGATSGELLAAATIDARAALDVYVRGSADHRGPELSLDLDDERFAELVGELMVRLIVRPAGAASLAGRMLRVAAGDELATSVAEELARR
jgi:hypothetical protein